MPTFNDSEAIQLLPSCDAKWTVTDFTIGISKGQKTRGSEQYEVHLSLKTADGAQGRTRENLIDHASCAWKIDTFLKSGGVNLVKGQRFSFRADEAARDGIAWINPVGLRGWCRVVVEVFERQDKTKGESNKIATFYTDREKLPRAADACTAPDPDGNPW